jgi:cryptochrome
MTDLSSSLTELNPKQRLLVLRGSPEKVLPVVWKEWGITHLVFEKVSPSKPLTDANRNKTHLTFIHVQDTAAYARQRDNLILALAKKEFPELKIIIKHGHNLFDPEEVVKKGNAGKPITTLTMWKRVG